MNKKGFTLIELLIAMAIASIVMAAMYSVYRVQTKQYRIQQMVVEMQQNMRAAVYLLEREIRMAGYDPKGDAGAAFMVAADNTITFSLRADDDKLDNNGDGDIDEPGELQTITYSLGDADGDGVHNLERLDITAAALPVVAAQNIINLNFEYRDQNNDVLTPTPLSAANLRSIRDIIITIDATSGEIYPGEPERVMSLTSWVKCRNMGY